MTSHSDTPLLQQYLREMRTQMDKESTDLSTNYATASQKKSNTLNAICADVASVVTGPERAWSALKLMYGLGKLAYEAYSVRQVVTQMDDYSERFGEFSRFAGKYSSPSPS